MDLPLMLREALELHFALRLEAIFEQSPQQSA